MQQRIKWLDVARCFGIFAIYLGHFGAQAGLAAQFVTTHYVALFFFISGCLTSHKPLSLAAHSKKILNDILLPWFFFALLAVVFDSIYSNLDLNGVLLQLKSVALGTMVDNFVAGSLWFFTTLAIVKFLFWFIQQLKNNCAILLISLAMFLIEALVDLPRYYNLHRAFRFMIFYSIGYITFPYIQKAIEPATKKGRCFFAVSGGIAFIYSAFLFFEKDLLSFMYHIPYLNYFAGIFTALIVIWLYFITAKFSENVDIFNQLGQNTLYLCGSEYFIKQILKTIIRLLGLEPTYPNPMAVFIYAALTMLLAYKYLIPLEKRMLTKIRQLPAYFC